MKVRESSINWNMTKCTNNEEEIFTGASGEPKRKEESSEEEDARKEAYTKAQSMKSLFQQGQTIAAKRWRQLMAKA